MYEPAHQTIKAWPAQLMPAVLELMGCAKTDNTAAATRFWLLYCLVQMSMGWRAKYSLQYNVRVHMGQRDESYG
jgi:hypothetical protein